MLVLILFPIMLFFAVPPVSCRFNLTLFRRLQQDAIMEFSQLDESILINVEEEQHSGETALFWHIPKAGGTTVHDLTSHCLGLVVASEVGTSHGHAKDKHLGVFTVTDGSQFVNVDTTTLVGMKKAKRLGFPNAEMADLVFTGFLPQSTHLLFNRRHRASAFALFRHPADRAISLFYYLRDATWEPTYHPRWAAMTLLEFLQEDTNVEHDWMVRNLVGEYSKELNQTHLHRAKEILRRKMWVGLINQMKESIMRFGAIFGWNKLKQWPACMSDFAHHGSNKHKHPQINKHSEEWKLLKKANYWDLQLYAYAVRLFEIQKDHFVVVDINDDVGDSQ